MGKDLCVKTEDGILNIRVGAIIMKDDKFLMAGNDRFDHLYSVGGRIKFGETAEEAVHTSSSFIYTLSHNPSPASLHHHHPNPP